jgi:hypothetical protein
MPDYTETAFAWLKYLSRVVLALMVIAMLYAAWLSLANWSFIAV